jgi:KaiC/GvpD/RAD55 family RecA-like ATPase
MRLNIEELSAMNIAINHNDTQIDPSAGVFMTPDKISHNHLTALKYAEAGIPVFPASHLLDKTKSYPSPKKKPPGGFCWSREATTNIDTINKWWGIEPDGLVAMPVRPNNLVVFDADQPRDNRPDGVKPFQDLVESNGGLPKGTVIVKTLSGGYHYILRQPEGMILGNGTGNLPKGIDVRGASGEGGYIIAPGTQWRAPDGSIREWKELENSPSLIEAHTSGLIPVVPDYLLDQLCEKKSEELFTLHSKTEIQLSNQNSSPNSRPDYTSNKQTNDYSNFTNWFEKADLDDEIAYVSDALNYLGSDDRDTWLLVGGALHDRFGEAGREIWDTWSQKSPKYDPIDQNRTWKSFSRPGIVKRATIGSIIERARKNGFHGRKYEEQSVFAQDKNYCENVNTLEKQNINDDEWDTGVCNETNLDEDVWFLGDALPDQPPSLVEGLIPDRGLVILGGSSGAGKTYIAAHLSTALASGQNFFGHAVSGPAGVIYIAAEGGDTLAPRLQAARIGLQLSSMPYPVAVVNRGIGNLSNEADLSRLIQKIKRLKAKILQKFGYPVRMVVLDTVSAAFSIKDENSAGEMSRLCKLLMVLGGCINAVTLAVHHYGKSTESGLRGSSSIRASADGVVAVLADRNELTGFCSNRRLVLVKSRTGVEGVAHAFDLESMEVATSGFDSVVAAKVVARGTAEADLKTGNNRPYSMGLKRFISALEQALIAYGQEIMVWTDAPIVRAVDREKVREIFYANTPADGDPTMISNRRRKAFERGYEDAEKRGLAKCYEHNGVQLMWLLP